VRDEVRLELVDSLHLGDVLQNPQRRNDGVLLIPNRGHLGIEYALFRPLQNDLLVQGKAMA